MEPHFDHPSGRPHPDGLGAAEASGGDIYVYDSLTLVRSLLAAQLVDELILTIEPVALGGGKGLFSNDGEMRRFQLLSAETSNTGVQICRYQPA
jgi:dihydrofolate reductase